MIKRHVRRRPARPFKDNSPIKGRVKAFFLSFTPRYFKDYWLSRAGAARVGKLVGAGFVFIFLVFLWYAKDLPTPGKINARIQAQTTRFYDRTGNKLIYEVLGDKNRSIVNFDQISQDAKNATIAIEDKDFYKHGSFSVVGYLRAAVVDLTHRGVRQGGSTITQQYVKNALLNPTDRSLGRKIKELILSIEIGQFYSKDTILTLYLNEIPYGNRAYGVESACKAFFPDDIDHADKDQHCAKNLKLDESAVLAAILNGPGYYSPFGSHQPELIERQHLVLDLMVDQKYITKDQAEAAKWKVEDLRDKTKISQEQNLYANLDPKLAYFVLYTQDFLEAKYGAATVTEGGLRVTTTIDLDKQTAAYDAVQNNMNTVTRGGGSNAALVSTDPKSGQILAMIGGHNFNDPNGGQVNVAARQRQPGSSFKPIVYATLFGKNKDAACAKTRDCPTYGPGTTLYDVPTSFGGNPEYKPNNFGNKNYGVLTARQALAGSLNVPAVKALAMAGISNSLQTAQSLGITTLNPSPNDYGLSLVLGTGGVELVEMANAYESFANGGQHFDQTPILMLKDQKNNIMEDNSKPKKGKQALDPQVASLMSDVLSDNQAKDFVFHGELALRNNCPNNSASGCVHVGVKTGTTEKFNDAWTMGFTQDVTAGVWVGNNDGSPMGGLAAADIAAPIWKAYMNAIINGKANSAFPKASGIKTVTLDKQTGRSVTSGTKNTTVDIFPSWYTAMSSTGGKNAQVDKVSGKLATDCTPPLARDTVYSSAILPEITKADNPSQFQLWLTALQRAGYSTSGGDLPTDPDDKHSCDDVKPTVNIVGANGGGPYNFTAQVESGTFGANKLQVYFDDQIISTQEISGSGSYPVTYSPTQTGSHTFKAVVTDAGLYQATDEQTVNVTNVSGGGGDFSGLSPSDGANLSSGPITFSWSADPGATIYTLFIDGAIRGTTTGNSRTVSGISNGNHTWSVRSDQGNTTDTLTFKVKP
jgi:membrane peptidoglycan carboxypeptidase